MPHRAAARGESLVVIGGSAGSIDVLIRLVAALPADLKACVLVAVHSGTSSVLAELLARRSALPVHWAKDRSPLLSGHVLVAPADTHLIVESGRAALSRGPKENGFRPSIDLLFRSAAREYGSRVIGVVLSGALDCGADGLRLIKALGGRGVVQHPDDALYPEMPRHAVNKAEPDAVVPAVQIPSVLGRMLEGKSRPTPAKVAPGGERFATDITCPECHGALEEEDAPRGAVFRCHVGHVFSMAGLSGEQSRELEASLWSAVRALRESEALAHRMASSRYGPSARGQKERARALARYADVITRFLLSPGLEPLETPADEPAGEASPRRESND